MLNEMQQIELAAKLLEISIKEASEYHSQIKEDSAIYVSIPEKGGASLIVGQDGEVLYADSSIGYSRHLEEYKKGNRTPIAAFEVD